MRENAAGRASVAALELMVKTALVLIQSILSNRYSGMIGGVGAVRIFLVQVARDFGSLNFFSEYILVHGP
jgi:hypothetical protein